MFSEDIGLKVDTILASKRSDDLKLFEIIQICKDELKTQNVQLYYALLGWKDAHLHDLQKEQAEWLRLHDAISKPIRTIPDPSFYGNDSSNTNTDSAFKATVKVDPSKKSPAQFGNY